MPGDSTKRKVWWFTDPNRGDRYTTRHEIPETALITAYMIQDRTTPRGA
jgi:hypothetical protein